MRDCRRTGRCRDCTARKTCPRSVREARRARRSKQMSASQETLRKAARVIDGRWLSAYELGCEVYGTPPQTMLGRKSVSVRARRALNRLVALGLVAVTPGGRTGRDLVPARYTLVPGGLEELGC